MARRRIVPSIVWPSWRYGPNGESAIFQSAAEVPSGWTRKPEEAYETPQPIHHDRHQLIADLTARGIVVKGHWSAAHMKDLLA